MVLSNLHGVREGRIIKKERKAPSSSSSSRSPLKERKVERSSPPESTASFIPKLFAMVSDPKITLIQWAPTGTYFIIFNPEDFAQQVLPVQFKHQNFTSFVRQLNMYGFHKVADLAHLPSSSSRAWAFEHPCFLKGKPHLLPEIQRRPKQVQRILGSPSPSSPPPSSSSRSSSSSFTEDQVKKARLVLEELAQVKQQQLQMNREFLQARSLQDQLLKQLSLAEESLMEQREVSRQVFAFLKACLQQNHALPTSSSSSSSSSPPLPASVVPSASPSLRPTTRSSASLPPSSPVSLVPQSKPTPRSSSAPSCPSPLSSTFSSSSSSSSSSYPAAPTGFRPLFPQSSAESPTPVPGSPSGEELGDDAESDDGWEQLEREREKQGEKEKEKEKEKARCVTLPSTDDFGCGGTSGASLASLPSSSSSSSSSRHSFAAYLDASVPCLPEELPHPSDFLHFQEELRIDELDSFEEDNGLGLIARQASFDDGLPPKGALALNHSLCFIPSA